MHVPDREVAVIEGIDHVGIAVVSIDESRRLYERLGLQVAAIEVVPQEGVRVAFIPCGESAIELLEPLDEQSPVGRFLRKRGPGVHHLCLATSDIEGDQRLLEDAGLELLRERPTRGASGCWIQFVHPRSADGVLLEIAQRMDPGHR